MSKSACKNIRKYNLSGFVFGAAFVIAFLIATTSQANAEHTAGHHQEVNDFIDGKRDSLYGIDTPEPRSTGVVEDHSLFIPISPPRNRNTAVKEFLDGKEDSLRGIDYPFAERERIKSIYIPALLHGTRGYQPYHKLLQTVPTNSRIINSFDTHGKYQNGFERKREILEQRFNTPPSINLSQRETMSDNAGSANEKVPAHHSIVSTNKEVGEFCNERRSSIQGVDARPKQTSGEVYGGPILTGPIQPAGPVWFGRPIPKSSPTILNQWFEQIHRENMVHFRHGTYLKRSLPHKAPAQPNLNRSRPSH